MPFLVFCLLLLLTVGAWFAWRWWQTARRDAQREVPFPEAWRALLERNVHLYRKLPPPLREQLHSHINVFLHSKTFHGCAGFEMSDEVRVVIAAQACMLLLNRDTDYFPGFSSILVYPGSFVARAVAHDGPIAGVAEDVRAGESWQRGPVVLSWDDVVLGAQHEHGAYNVVIHEFAHKLDEENSSVDGVPWLEDASQYRTWADVLGQEYEALRAQRGSQVLDRYGASSPAEFFAVATETFFERPHALAEQHGALYEVLKRYYKVDPCTWPG